MLAGLFFYCVVTGAKRAIREIICGHLVRLIILEIVNSEGKAMSSVLDKQFETFAKRHFSKSALICPIYASGSNFGTQ